jgi:hypothetical protein
MATSKCRSPDGANGSRECAPDDRLRAIRESIAAPDFTSFHPGHEVRRGFVADPGVTDYLRLVRGTVDVSQAGMTSIRSVVARMEPTGRANARPMTGSAQSGNLSRPRISLRSIRATKFGAVSSRSGCDRLPSAGPRHGRGPFAATQEQARAHGARSDESGVAWVCYSSFHNLRLIFGAPRSGIPPLKNRAGTVLNRHAPVYAVVN